MLIGLIMRLFHERSWALHRSQELVVLGYCALLKGLDWSVQYWESQPAIDGACLDNNKREHRLIT